MMNVNKRVTLVSMFAVACMVLAGCANPLEFPVKSSEKDITSFYFEIPEARGQIDESDASIMVEFPAGTDLDLSFIASFETTGQKVKIRFKVQTSGETPNSFDSPILYTVVAEDGTTKKYTVRVSVAIADPVDPPPDEDPDDPPPDEDPDDPPPGEDPDDPPPAGYPYGYLSVSRSTGVAPLYVHFSADFSGAPEKAAGFRTYDYSWDFGDPGSGVWGTNGTSMNLSKGGVAAHVFEQPGTYSVSLTVREGSSIIGSEVQAIQVIDPASYYAGIKTICVSDSAATVADGAPAGALLVATTNLSSITKYATTGSRILFRRGSSWSTPGLSWPENAGPVTLGAYGPGGGIDAQGHYANAPRITITGGQFLALDFKQDWRIMDLHLIDTTRTHGSFGGTMEFRKHLFLRLRIDGFYTGFGWSHWNTSRLMTIDQMAVVSCRITESLDNIAYVGSERLALLGNILQNVRESHVLRVWQAYRSVISHNIVSGSSLAETNGRHALKLHGPGYSTFQGVNEYGTPVPDSNLLGNRTEYVVVSGNVFGSSGPWPVAIGPQDDLTDAELYHIVFERNRIISEYGDQSVRPVDVAMHLWGGYSTIRNNIFDGTNSGPDYTGLVLEQRGSEPAPDSVEVYNNTIYRSDNGTGNRRVGIFISSNSRRVNVKNNLVSFPGATMATTMIEDGSGVAVKSGNLMTAAAGFTDPDVADPLSRNFRLDMGAPGINAGVSVPVYEDFAGAARIDGGYDIGAYEN
jgi:PKD repeat protein